jgi:hypothetical protein
MRAGPLGSPIGAGSMLRPASAGQGVAPCANATEPAGTMQTAARVASIARINVVRRAIIVLPYNRTERACAWRAGHGTEAIAKNVGDDVATRPAMAFISVKIHKASITSGWQPRMNVKQLRAFSKEP